MAEHESDPKSDPAWLVVGLFAAVAFAATIVSTANGPGLSPDSVNYISVGLNLADGAGLVTYSGERLTVFPPGLPFIVAGGDIIGMSVEWTIRLVNAAAFAATVALSAVLLHRHVRSRSLAIGGTVFVAMSVPLLAVANMAWTEPLFIVITLVFLLGLEHALREPRNLAWIVTCATLVWAAFFMRYAGVSMVAVGGVTLLLGQWTVHKRLALRNAFMFGVLASLGPVMWLLRNTGIDGTLMGPRPSSTDTPSAVAVSISSTIGQWLVPMTLPGRLPAVIGLGVFVALAFAAALLLRSSKGLPTGLWPDMVPTFTFVGGYLAYLVTAQLTTALDVIDTRLLSPIFVPVVVVAAVALDGVSQLAPSQARRWAGVALLAIVVLHGAKFIQQAHLTGQQGQGYASSAWQSNELVAATTELPADAILYTSEPWGIWAATRSEPVLLSPRLRPYRSNETIEIPRSFIDDANCGDAWLAWFAAGSPSYLRTPDQLAEVVTLEPVTVLEAGTLYRLGPLGEPQCDDGG